MPATQDAVDPVADTLANITLNDGSPLVDDLFIAIKYMPTEILQFQPATWL